MTRYKLVKNADLLTTPLFYDYDVVYCASIDLRQALSKVYNPIKVVGVEHRSDGKHNIKLADGSRDNSIDLQRLLVERK